MWPSRQASCQTPPIASTSGGRAGRRIGEAATVERYRSGVVADPPGCGWHHLHRRQVARSNRTAAGAEAEFALITDLIEAVGLAHPDTIAQLESFALRSDSEHLDRVVELCLEALPQVREQAGHGSRAHRQVLCAGSNAALSRSRDPEMVDVRR